MKGMNVMTWEEIDRDQSFSRAGCPPFSRRPLIPDPADAPEPEPEEKEPTDEDKLNESIMQREAAGEARDGDR